MTAPTAATPLTVAVRQWHEPVPDDDNPGAQEHVPRHRTDPPPKWPGGVLAFDTETTTDRAQRLIFGWYRYARWQPDGTLATVEEGTLTADDLPERNPAGFRTLQTFAKAHAADVAFNRYGAIRVRFRRDFLNDVLWPAIRAEALICGLNLPFDLSRLAVAWGETRRRRKRQRQGMPPSDVFVRGFSLALWEYQDKVTGAWRANSYRPRVRIKHVDTKRAFIGLGPVRQRDRRDPPPGGRFLDMKTLGFSVTNKGLSLKTACEVFGVAEGKATAERHGVIDATYIEYARQDVRAYVGLLERLRAEFDRHPIDLLPERAHSPASITKGYLRIMGITPLLDREPILPRAVIGQTMSAFYGGRTECRIRRTPVPIIHTDFLAMYMSVQALLGVWQYVTADCIEVVDATAEVQAFLGGMTLDAAFTRELWPQLTFFAQIVPDGDILPVRAQYDGAAFTIGVNPLSANRQLWYAGPDLVASILLSGKPPKVLRAFHLVPHGTLSTLQPTSLGGVVPINPRHDDFSRFVVEERQRIKQATTRGEPVPAHVEPFLKVLANAGYGLFAELNRQELPSGEQLRITVYSASDEPFAAKTNAPEMPGRMAYPPLAALITSAARLMLALLEREVTDRGGTYAFCDTDSMAIVATERGGLVPCPGGSERTSDGSQAIQALTWAEVDAIVARFTALNPYDPSVVSGSILEIEKVNIDPATGERRQLWCFAISAKRYALFVHDEQGMPAVVDDGYSEHGLGHLLNPDDPDSDNREWIRTVWTGLIHEELGLPFTWPSWVDRSAMSRLSASSPHVLNALSKNQTSDYAGSVKPFNFLISPHVAPLGHPPGADSQHFHLIAPYTKDARQWTKLRWTNVYSGEQFTISTREGSAGEGVARVQSYGEVIARYRVHPEAKSLGPDGLPCGKRTVGLLGRRPVALGELVHIGKESNRLEEVEQGLVHDWDEVQLVVRDPNGVPSPSSDETRPAVLCRSCGAPVSSTRANYCSVACRQSAYRQRSRSRHAGA